MPVAYAFFNLADQGKMFITTSDKVFPSTNFVNR